MQGSTSTREGLPTQMSEPNSSGTEPAHSPTDYHTPYLCSKRHKQPTTPIKKERHRKPTLHQELLFQFSVNKTEENGFSCPVPTCGRKYSRFSDLKSHFAMKHYDNIPEYPMMRICQRYCCPVCYRAFPRKKNLIFHWRSCSQKIQQDGDTMILTDIETKNEIEKETKRYFKLKWSYSNNMINKNDNNHKNCSNINNENCSNINNENTTMQSKDTCCGIDDSSSISSSTNFLSKCNSSLLGTNCSIDESTITTPSNNRSNCTDQNGGSSGTIVRKYSIDFIVSEH